MSRLAQPVLIEKFLMSASLAICLYFLVTFLLLVIGNFWPGPLFDYWVDIPLVEKYFDHQLTFNELVTAHNNAHRILIPRILFFLDHDYFAGTNILLIAVSLLCKAMTLLLFNILLKNQARQTKLLLNALMFAAILNAGNVYNILFTFDIQWDLVSVFACFSLFFYTRMFERHNRLVYRMLAYLFLCLGFLSHAGALFLPLTFIIISIFKRNHAETVINCLLAIAIFYLNSLLPTSDTGNADVQSAFVTLILYTHAAALFVTKFVSGSLAFYLGTPGYYFSIYMLALLGTGVLLSIKNRRVNHYCCNHIFLYFSLFLFLMIVSIAAARSIFNPNVWAASRFQTTVLLFILCLHIHVWLGTVDLLKNKSRMLIQSALALHGFLIFFLIQYFTYNIPCKLSNVVFFSQAYMLTHERNQNNGPRLLLWIHDDDVIANSDPFFRKNGLAWYANKQLNHNGHLDFVDTGKSLLAPEAIAAFGQSCNKHIRPLAYQQTTEGGIEFSTSPNSGLGKWVPETINRRTYYAIDQAGTVVGFAYPVVNENGFLKTHVLNGYSVSESIAFFAEMDNNHQPTCLYSVAQEN